MDSKITEALSKALGIECDVEIEYSDCILFDPITNREEAIKRNAEIVECDRCGTKGNRPNMMRWHFENCRTELKNCKHCGNVIPRQGVKDYLYDQKIFCNRKCYMKSKVGRPPIIMTEEVKDKLSLSAKKTSMERSNRMKSNKVWTKSGRWTTK